MADRTLLLSPRNPLRPPLGIAGVSGCWARGMNPHLWPNRQVRLPDFFTVVASRRKLFERLSPSPTTHRMRKELGRIGSSGKNAAELDGICLKTRDGISPPPCFFLRPMRLFGTRRRLWARAEELLPRAENEEILVSRRKHRLALLLAPPRLQHLEERCPVDQLAATQAA